MSGPGNPAAALVATLFGLAFLAFATVFGVLGATPGLIFLPLALLCFWTARDEYLHGIALASPARPPGPEGHATIEALPSRHPLLSVRREDGLLVASGRMLGHTVRVTSALDDPARATCRVLRAVPPELAGGRLEVDRNGDGFVGLKPLPEALRGRRARGVLDAVRSRGLEVWFDADGLRADTRLRAGEVEDTLEVLARVVSLLGKVEAPAMVLHERTSGGTTCPYCRAGVEQAEAAACDACGTVHHAACLEEHGRCTVPGCSGRRARDRARA